MFDPNLAFSRTLGWITDSEFAILQQKRVAIAGVGGVGGHYCEVMARLGVRKFHLADLDQFEIQNFNRQNASGMSTVGRPKIEVLRERILDINPSAEIKTFNTGLNRENLSEFLNGVDLYLDGLDFFVLFERIFLFNELRRLGIPGLIMAPVGMGTALVVFNSQSMSFEDYFGLSESVSIQENALRFLVGLSPSLLQRKYQVDPSRVNFAQKKVPSTPMGCYLCAGVGGSEALKTLLGRGEVKGAPWSLHFDAYTHQYKKTYLWWGAKNPIQRIKLAYARKKVGMPK